MSPERTPASDSGFRLDEKIKSRRWYGWQNLIVDSAAGLTLWGASATQQSALGFLGLSMYISGSPIVHWGNDEGTKGAISLLARVTLLTMAIATAISQNMDDTDNSKPGMAPFILLSAAPMVDACCLAWRVVETRRYGLQAAPRAPIAPSWALTPRGGYVGLGGSF
jgi:hypothetical protein